MPERTEGHDQNDNDESLMRRTQAGEGAAFDVLFERYAAHVINFAHRYGLSREESEDVAQDVLMRVHDARERFDPSRPFRPWLFSIAMRLISNHLRHKKRHPLLSFFGREPDAEEPQAPMDPPDPPSSRPEQTVEKRHLAAVVRAALARLPDNQRTAVILSRYEDMSQEDISRAMGVSIPAVKSLLFRAQLTLKDRLTPYLSQ